MALRFRDLGAPFPLFDAPVSDTSDYIGAGTCGLCGEQAAVRFRLEVGAAVMAPCPACGVVTGVSATGDDDSACRACGAELEPPDTPAGSNACYACLRAGRAALTKDTELGMISWEQAFVGVTHGAPGLAHPDFEMVPHPDSDWIGARLPQETMFELLRTPTYDTIQGDSWQFCCRQPMVFVGAWDRQAFTGHAPDGDGRKLFEDVVDGCIDGLWEDELHDETGVYVFRCPACARLKAHWDIA
jgi:hypothetical protein